MSNFRFIDVNNEEHMDIVGEVISSMFSQDYGTGDAEVRDDLVRAIAGTIPAEYQHRCSTDGCNPHMYELVWHYVFDLIVED